MDERTKKKLKKAIARYSESCYRRGFQHAIEDYFAGYGIDKEFASRFRHKPLNGIYEIYPGDPTKKIKAKFYRRQPIEARLAIEPHANEINEILYALN